MQAKSPRVQVKNPAFGNLHCTCKWLLLGLCTASPECTAEPAYDVRKGVLQYVEKDYTQSNLTCCFQ